MFELDKALLLNGKIEVLSGFAFPSSGFNQLDGLPLIRIRDLGGSTTEVRFRGAYDPAYRVSKGDLLVAMDGDFEVHRWEGEDALLNQRVCRISSSSREIDQGFLYWYLKPKIAEIHRRTPQTTVRHLSTKDIYTISEPPIGFPAQERIAQILDTLDTAIRETEALIDKLKAVRQGLLHDLLTRGVDANGQLRPPQSEAPQLYKESPLGWISKEWEASTVEAEFDVESGITLGAHRVPRNNPKQYLRVANVHRARLLLEDIATLQASDTEASLRGLHPGDLLVVEGHASTEEIGRCAMADESVRGLLFQNHLFRLRAKRLLSVFGLLWMNSAFVRAYWRCEAATSSGLNTINRTKLNRLDVAVPSLSEQERIVSVELDFASRLRREEQTLEKLKREKIALMEDLLTGRVRVTPLLESMHQSSAQTGA
ncbi:restriction endonuclease subunit S [Pseudomonas sp. TNT2022 ID233]|uniref:restriction endonuclease subunit S n=1 Tax=Pseudomonas aphyarum TaxID=2942629 RepID=UPI00235FBA50|nr:restriction endonuclease subunit S [Pseudomonas aphyarum]MDD1139248.1 restriction endonuclease subunit S [Pseudomonas aphyarum]